MTDEKPPYFIRAVIDAHTMSRPEISENTAAELENLGLIKRYGVENQWTTTGKGAAYVMALGKVPLPVQQWIIPKD